jgi:hypothetical protein
LAELGKLFGQKAPDFPLPIATNVLAKVSEDIAQITGTAAEDLALSVRRALA